MRKSVKHIYIVKFKSIVLFPHLVPYRTLDSICTKYKVLSLRSRYYKLLKEHLLKKEKEREREREREKVEGRR